MNKLLDNPKRLLFIDMIGALVSAMMLGVVLVHFKAFVGIPITALYILAAIPVFFALFDFVGLLSKSPYLFLRIIAVLNFLYCVLSLGMAFYHESSLTLWGWVYIIGEIIIVCILARIEWTVAQESQRN